MRVILLRVALASMVASLGCNGDRALAPQSGHSGQIVPPELIAAYTQINLPGHGIVVALNDSGDVVADEFNFGGGMLWHGAAHDTTPIPIHPVAIANDGTVAGNIDGHAATWKNGRVAILDTAASQALAICKCNSAIVVGVVTVNGVAHAAIWVDGIRIDAGLPQNGISAEFRAIGGGFIVGNATVRVPNPDPGAPGESTDYLEPYSWSHAEGWVRLRHGPVSFAAIVSMNSHGIAVGFNKSEAVYFDVGAGTGEVPFPSNPFFPDMRPTGINDSGRVSGLGLFVDSLGFTSGNQVALVGSTSTGAIAALPPGLTQDPSVAGINNAGIIAGNNPAAPVLWIPNP